MGGYRNSMLPDPYVPEVPVPDYGKNVGNALALAGGMGKFQDAQYERGARDTYSNALAQGGDPRSALVQSGYGSEADKYERNALAATKDRADMMGRLDEFVRGRASLAQSQDDWDQVLAETQARFGVKAPDAFRQWTPDLSRKLAMGGLSAAQQIELDFKRSSEQRAQAEESRKAALFPGQVAQQGADLDYRRQQTDILREDAPARAAEREAKIQKLNAQTQIIQSKFGREYDQIQIHPGDQYGFKPPYATGVNRATGQPTVLPLEDPSGVLAGAGPQGGEAPQAPTGDAFGPDQLREAVRTGKVSRGDAEKYARNMGWIR